MTELVTVAESDGPLWAASRDASVWNRPNIRSRKRLHIAINVVDLPGTWWETGERHGEAACDPGRLVLDMSVASRAANIPEQQRCRRPGCAARWPDYQPDRPERKP